MDFKRKYVVQGEFLAVISLLTNYEWKRPIYFASIMGMQANRYLQKHMYLLKV